MAREHPNVELARRLWLSVAEGDGETIEKLCASDVLLRAYGRNTMSGEYHGHEGVFDYLAASGEEADELRSELQSIFANDDGAVLLYHVSATSGSKSLEMETMLLLRIEDGQVTEAHSVPMDQAANDLFWGK